MLVQTFRQFWRHFFHASALMGKKEKRREKRKEKFAQREACAENQPKEIENECYSNINFIQVLTIQGNSTSKQLSINCSIRLYWKAI